MCPRETTYFWIMDSHNQTAASTGEVGHMGPAQKMGPTSWIPKMVGQCFGWPTPHLLLILNSQHFTISICYITSCFSIYAPHVANPGPPGQTWAQTPEEAEPSMKSGGRGHGRRGQTWNWKKTLAVQFMGVSIHRYIYIYTYWLVVLTILKNMKVNGKDYPIYYRK